jgi:hypothetical protein
VEPTYELVVDTPGGETIVVSRRSRPVHETCRPLVYYVPSDAVTPGVGRPSAAVGRTVGERRCGAGITTWMRGPFQGTATRVGW